jgi:putative membrane protein
MSMIDWKVVVASVTFSMIGVAILLLVFFIVEKLTPENLWKQIVEKQNVALAIMAGFFMLAIAWIIGAAIHG